MSLLVAVALALVGVVTAAAGLASLRRRSAERRSGELVAIDAGAAVTLRSERYRLVGRPDELRRRRGGAVIPVELKHRPAPRGRPFPSHLVQLGAYCLLVEEVVGRPPPHGVLRYRDGEVVVPWDRATRAAVLSALEASTAPYDGRADPSPAKCASCRWSPVCDASWTPKGSARPAP